MIQKWNLKLRNSIKLREESLLFYEMKDDKENVKIINLKDKFILDSDIIKSLMEVKI